MGIIGAVFGLAFLLGPFIAGILLKFYSWNVLFTINIPISIILIYYSSKLIPSVPSKRIQSIDWMGIMMLGVCLATLTYGLNTLSGISAVFNWENTLTVSPFIVAFVSFIFLVRIEKRAEFPIVELSFFQNRQIVIAGLLAISTGVMQACFVFIPKFVVESFSVASSTASFMLTPFVLATAFGSPIFGKMIDRIGVKIVVIIGLLLSSSGFFLLSISGAEKMIYYTSGVFIGLGMSVLSGSSLRYIMLNNTSQQDRATSQGMLTIFISLGQLIATALIGVISATLIASRGYTSIFMATAILLVVMVFLAFGLKNQAENAGA